MRVMAVCEQSGSGTLQVVDVPVTMDAGKAAQMALKLERGEEVTLELSPEDCCPSVVEQIRWQLDNDEPVTTLRDAYLEDGDTDA